MIHFALGVAFEASIFSVVAAEQESTIEMPRNEHVFKSKGHS